MNAERRKALAKVAELTAQARVAIDEALGIVNDAKDEEQEYYDNMPESLQSGEKGERANEAVSQLEEAASRLEEALSGLDEVDSNVEMASE